MISATNFISSIVLTTASLGVGMEGFGEALDIYISSKKQEQEQVCVVKTEAMLLPAADRPAEEAKCKMAEFKKIEGKYSGLKQLALAASTQK